MADFIFSGSAAFTWGNCTFKASITQTKSSCGSPHMFPSGKPKMEPQGWGVQGAGSCGHRCDATQAEQNWEGVCVETILPLRSHHFPWALWVTGNDFPHTDSDCGTVLFFELMLAFEQFLSNHGCAHRQQHSSTRQNPRRPPQVFCRFTVPYSMDHVSHGMGRVPVKSPELEEWERANMDLTGHPHHTTQFNIQYQAQKDWGGCQLDFRDQSIRDKGCLLKLAILVFHRPGLVLVLSLGTIDDTKETQWLITLRKSLTNKWKNF